VDCMDREDEIPLVSKGQIVCMLGKLCHWRYFMDVADKFNSKAVEKSTCRLWVIQMGKDEVFLEDWEPSQLNEPL
jgi:hypothetical protein